MFGCIAMLASGPFGVALAVAEVVVAVGRVIETLNDDEEEE